MVRSNPKWTKQQVNNYVVTNEKVSICLTTKLLQLETTFTPELLTIIHFQLQKINKNVRNGLGGIAVKINPFGRMQNFQMRRFVDLFFCRKEPVRPLEVDSENKQLSLQNLEVNESCFEGSASFNGERCLVKVSDKIISACQNLGGILAARNGLSRRISTR